MTFLTPKDVEIEVICEPENDVTPEDSFAYDTEAENQEAIDWIRSELDSGNEWAWCAITVRASFGGETGEDHLGGCSYRSREDFIACGDYYSDMVAEALRALEAKLLTRNRAETGIGE